MARPLKPATPYHTASLASAIEYLKLALDYAKQAEAPRLADKIRRALKSADGARRHAERRADVSQ